MDCKRVVEVLFLYVDNELDDELRNPFRQHLAVCGECAQRTDYTRKFLLIVRKKCLRFSAPVELRERILTSMPHRRGVHLEGPSA